MEIRVEGRHKADIGVLYQKANKQRFEIEAKIDSIDIGSVESSEKLITQTRNLLESYTLSVNNLNLELTSMAPEEQDPWQMKLGKLKKYNIEMNNRLQRVVQLRNLAQKKTNGSKAKRKGDEEESEVKHLVDEQDGLVQSQRIAVEIQNYGAMVWHSIKEQSGKLQVAKIN